MRLMMFSKLVPLMVFIGFIGIGCKSSNETAALTKIPTTANNAGGDGNSDAGGGDINPLGPGNPGDNGGNPEGTDVGGNPIEPLTIPENYREERNVFASVHFDYDSAELRPGDMNLITQVAEYLMQNPAHLLLVEGHCDERGTEDYNISLGERRALAVADELSRLGISPDRLRTTSYGEKLPMSGGSTEQSYAQNRRGEFVLLKPAN